MADKMHENHNLLLIISSEETGNCLKNAKALPSLEKANDDEVFVDGVINIAYISKNAVLLNDDSIPSNEFCKLIKYIIIRNNGDKKAVAKVLSAIEGTLITCLKSLVIRAKIFEWVLKLSDLPFLLSEADSLPAVRLLLKVSVDIKIATQKNAAKIEIPIPKFFPTSMPIAVNTSH